MIDPYVKNKNLQNLVSRFDLVFEKNRFVAVFIWGTVEALRENTRFEVPDHVGAYVGYRGRKKKGLFGEIHLIPDMIGVGYVAHEIGHFIYDWYLSDENYADPDINEKMAWLTGEITSAFWTEYYKTVNYEIDGKGNKVRD